MIKIFRNSTSTPVQSSSWSSLISDQRITQIFSKKIFFLAAGIACSYLLWKGLSRLGFFHTQSDSPAPSPARTGSTTEEDDFKEEVSLPEQTELERWELIRRIRPEKMKEFQQQLMDLTVTEDTIQAFKNGEWTDPVFKQLGWHELAFKAYFDGSISHLDLQKLCLFCCCQTLHANGELSSFEQRQLFDGNKFDEHSQELFLRAFFECYPVVDNNLAKEKFEEFLKKIKTINPFDTQFFIIKRNDPNDDEIFETLINYGKKSGRVKPWERFSTITDSNQSISEIICLPKIINLVHLIFKGPKAKQGMPCFGYLEKEKLSNLDYRPILIPCPLLHRWGVPGRIDKGSWKIPLTATFHDQAFHVLIEAQMPYGHRKAFTDFAMFLNEQLNGNLDKEIFLTFLDKDFRAYGNFKPPEAFWRSMENTFGLFDRMGLNYQQVIDLFYQFFTPSKLKKYSISLDCLNIKYSLYLNINKLKHA